ncbi:hypothetical protein CRG98_000756 [Punica granatum]|uniref:Uncharacterized protein n=1 Tax=Punica granatum TaxID=22663 RepID=A0A2I0LDY7_PUNGR|nr:hypothetical protein CRG98_000756 [Punica granatum]
MPPQPNSPPDNVFRPDRPAEADLRTKRRGVAPPPIHGINNEAFGYLKRVIVTPAVYQRLVEFLHFDIQSTGQKSRCICTDNRFARAHARGFTATDAPSYSSGPGPCPDGRVSAQLGTVTRLPVHPASPVLLTQNGPLGALDSVARLSEAAALPYLFKWVAPPDLGSRYLDGRPTSNAEGTALDRCPRGHVLPPPRVAERVAPVLLFGPATAVCHGRPTSAPIAATHPLIPPEG